MFSELKDFLRCATGSPYHQGNTVNVLFMAEADSPAFAFCTCGHQVAISELIQSEEKFMFGMKAVLEGRGFTAP